LYEATVAQPALSAGSAALPMPLAAAVAVVSPTLAGSRFGCRSIQLGTLPRVLPYVVLLVFFAIAFAGAYWMPDPIEKRGPFVSRPSA
jgi:hypothetical protein